MVIFQITRNCCHFLETREAATADGYELSITKQPLRLIVRQGADYTGIFRSL